MSDEDARYISTKVSDGVAEVILHHPPFNLLDRELFRAMRHVVRDLEADDDVRVIVFSSAVTGFFLAHFDVGMIRDFPQRIPRPTTLNTWHVLCEAVRTMPKVTIAMLDGRAGGAGAEFALACDMRFAAEETAVLCQPETGMGLMAVGGGTQHLPRVAGRSRALEILLGADDFDARLAERYNWVNRAMPQRELAEFVAQLARRIASFPPEAVAATKRAVLRTAPEVHAGLLQDQIDEAEFRPQPCRVERIERFLALGGQTLEAERRLGSLFDPDAASDA
jgi:enoyl-CoA hydratase/carnithine racemase